jgi:hypothetical protein
MPRWWERCWATLLRFGKLPRAYQALGESRNFLRSSGHPPEEGLLGFAVRGGRGAGGGSAPRAPSKPCGELNRGPRVDLYWVLLREVALNAGSGTEPLEVARGQSGAARYGIDAGGVRRREISVEARRLQHGQNAGIGRSWRGLCRGGSAGVFDDGGCSRS